MIQNSRIKPIPFAAQQLNFGWENKYSSIKFKRTAITFESDLWTGGQIYVDIVKKVRTSHRSPVTLPKWLPAAGWVNISTKRSRGRWTFWQLIRLKNGPGCAITWRKQGPELVSLGHVSFYDLGSSSSDTAGPATCLPHLYFIYAINFLYNTDTEEEPICVYISVRISCFIYC